jgi:hypothetical protein
VSYRIPRFVYAEYCVYCRRRAPARRFARIVTYRFPRLFLLGLGIWIGVSFPASCLVAFRSHVRCLRRLELASIRYASRLSASFCRRLIFWLPSSTLYMVSWVVVPKTGGGLPASWLVASLDSCTLYMESFVGISTLGVVLWVSCGVSMLLLAWFGIEVGFATVGVATLSVGSIMSCHRASRGSSTIHTLIFRQRRDSRRLFFIPSVVACGISRLICAKDGILCRRCNAYRRGSLRGFVCVMSYVIPRVICRWLL